MIQRNRYSTLARQMQAYQGRPGLATVVYDGGSPVATTADVDTGIYYGKDWGIIGGPEDESAKLQLMLNEVGANGGGHVVLRARNPSHKLTFRKLSSIYYNNVHLEFRSPQVLGKVAGFRIMGRMNEEVRAPATAGGKLDVNAVEGTRIIQLASSPTSMQAGDFLLGDYIVLRGLNRFDGNAIQKQYLFVTAIDLINNRITVHEELEETFQPAYAPGFLPIESSEYGPDSSTGSVIKIVKSCQLVANVLRGTYEFEVYTVANVAVGDIIRLADTRTEIQMNSSAIRANGLPYENECNMEFARVIKIVPTTDGKGIVTLDHAVCKNYLAGAPYYGVISIAVPVKNSRISGVDITYDEVQDSKNYHAVTIAFGFNCHTFDGHIDGYYGRKGQGYRIADSYLCSGHNLLVEGGYSSESGENYGLTGYKCTGCWYTDSIAKDCRHGFLLQASSLFTIRDCQSWGDKISGFDLHGALEYDTVLENCLAIRSNQHTGDANNGAGYRAGNTSHTPGSKHVSMINCIAVGYKETNCAGFDFLPDSENIDLMVCRVFDCYYGFTFTRNSKQVTPVQDVNNVRLFGCVVYDATDRAYRIIGAPDYVYDPETGIGNSNGKVTSLSFKECVTVRCSRHWVIDGNAGVTNLIMEGNDVMEPVALAGEHVYDISDVGGIVAIRNNGAVGGNKGLKVTNCPNYVAVTNLLSPTIEGVAFTDGGGNTGGVYVDVFAGGTVSAATQLIATNSTIVGGTGVKGTYIQGAGTDGVRFWAGYSGYGAYWDGTNWKVGTDGLTNAASITMSEGLTGGLRKFVFPNTGGIVQTIAPGALATYEQVDLSATAFDARGDLLVGLGSNTFSRIPLGVTPGMVLTVHPDNEAGVYWGNPASQFTSNATVTSTTPAFQLSESDGPDFKKNWGWVASSGSLRLRLYSDDFTTSLDNIFFRRGVAEDLLEVEFLPMKIGIGISPTRSLHLSGTFKLEGYEELWTSLAWAKSIELEENSMIQWLRGSAAISRGIGFSSDGNLYIARSTANGAAGTMFYDWILTAAGTMHVYNRMYISSHATGGSAGIWFNDAGGTARSFVGLYEDDATPIFGVYIGGTWRFYINSSGEMSIAGAYNRLPVPGALLTIPGLLRLYQTDNYARYTDWFINAGTVYISNYDTGAGGYMPFQFRGRNVSLWVTPNTGSGGELEAFRATFGSNQSYMPLTIQNNNTYREINGGSLVIAGSGTNSHFYYGPNEDTYLRQGKFNSTVYISDIGHIVIGGAGYTATILSNFNAWIALPYTTNFSDYNTGSNTNGRYRKIGDIVFVEGFIKRASGNTDTTFATLPAGYRPTKDFNYPTQILCNGTYYHARITINTSGNMTITYPLGTTWSTLTIGYIIIDTNFSTQ